MYNQVMSLQNSPTYRRSLAERLERERASKNNGTIPGGLASMIDAGMAGYLRYRDDQDRTKAQSAMMGGITEATDIGEMGEDQIPAGPEGALYRLGQLEDNPYAGRLSQMLTFEQMQRQQQAEAAQQQFQMQLARDQMNNQARVQAAQAGRSSVNVNAGNMGPQVGTIPQGFQLAQDPETDAYRMEPIPGGPAARDIASEERAAELKARGEERKTNLVIEDIGRFREKIKSAPWYSPVTGFGGALLSNVPGSGAYNAARIADTVRAHIGFDRLQQMRDESPTGGALGAINNQEMMLLQSVMGSLDQAQSEEQLLFNLERLDRIYRDLARKASAYPNAAKYGFGQGGDIGSGIQSVPQGQQQGGGGGTATPSRRRYNPQTGQFEVVR